MKQITAVGERGRQLWTPRGLVCGRPRERCKPFQGRVCDPCCGLVGMFVRSGKFIEVRARGNGDRATGAQISTYGRELNDTTWQLAKIDLAIRGSIRR